jgi:molybdenum ABC transporter molybdate-binding protein
MKRVTGFDWSLVAPAVSADNIRVNSLSPQRVLPLFLNARMVTHTNSSLGLAMRGLLSTLLCAAPLMAASAAQARDLVVYGEPTLERALRSIGTLWRARTGTRVNVFVAPSELSYAQIDRGARCDVIFALAGAVTDAAARSKIIHADTIRAAVRNSLALIGTETHNTPSGEAAADLATLIAGKRLAIADPERDVAGARALDLLHSIGITVDHSNTSVVVAESSAGVVSLLATNKAQLGIVYATDAPAGFRLAVPLAAPGQLPIDYVVATARDPALDTQPFMSFLTTAEAKMTFRSAGLASIDDVGRQR